MARQVLENGVILPAEYSDDWYDDMTSNLTKLDDVIGSDSEKLSSADVGAAALSNNYNDLDNLPTIPTVNDATLTIQKNGVNVQTFTANSSSNVTADITVPTKTSDLTNDSNFVDTSNPAVASGITSAKVTSYDAHIADTDIHVTTADKTKWNNQTYVFRYSSTALVASSTNSNALLDNTDNLKVGDKVIDSDGVLFSITAIDTQNSTFTIGTALIDLAQDSDVVHTSGNETVGGVKTFTDNLNFKSNSAEYGVTSGNIQFYLMDKNSNGLSRITQGVYANGISYITLQIYGRDENSQSVSNIIRFQYSSDFSESYLFPSDTSRVWLGTAGNRWAKVYGTQYYYGSNNVEFSTKFVTTDTAQTVSGNKTFSGNVLIYDSNTSVDARYLILKNQKVKRGSTTETGTQFITFHDKDGGTLVSYETNVSPSGNTQAYINVSNVDANSQRVVGGVKVIKTPTETWFIPDGDNTVSSGLSNYKWKDCQTNLINGLTPSSLSLPSNTGYVDISSYFTNTGDGQTNSYTASANGWIYLNVVAKSLIMQIRDSNDNVVYADMCNRSSDGTIYMTIPISSGNKLLTQWFTSSSVTVSTARFIPCQGNV